jgi:hypothetical protein
MFTWLKTLLTRSSNQHQRRKRANRAYHRKVRARERELRRAWNHEEVANRFFYWAPYSSQRPSKEAVQGFREKKTKTKGRGDSTQDHP